MKTANGVGEIRTEKVPQCPLCEAEKRKVLYTNLSDRLFGASGEWTFKECRGCGLVFLDPRPTVKDLWKVYANYYTHYAKATPKSLASRLRRYVRGGYLAVELGHVRRVTLLQRLTGLLAYLHPAEREIIKSSVMYLLQKRRGRALDVGCGPGEVLKELRSLGWEVEGVDFDARAAEAAAQSYGLKVRVGTLEDQSYPSEHFDAVGMSHVIEHAHDPVALLAECWRILKPGGCLVVATPNVRSLGHRLSGSSWSSLVPPSHLWLFSSTTLLRAACEAGIPRAKVRTTVRGAYGVSIDTYRMRKSQPTVGQPPGSMLEKLRGHLFQYVESVILWFIPGAGEELLMLAVKDGGETPKYLL